MYERHFSLSLLSLSLLSPSLSLLSPSLSLISPPSPCSPPSLSLHSPHPPPARKTTHPKKNNIFFHAVEFSLRRGRV